MTKSICALTMALSLSFSSCVNDKSVNEKQEIQEFIPAYCAMELRDVLVQNLYVQVLQQSCYHDSYKIIVNGCKRDPCYYVVPKEEYLRKL